MKEPDAEQFVDISNVFELNLTQSLGEQRNPIVELTIVEPQECNDVFINSDLIETSKDIILEINSISKPVNCNQAEHVVRKNHELHSASGAYNFSVTLASAEANNGTITIQDDVVDMQFQNLIGITAGNLTLRMIQDGFMWGYIKLNSTSNLHPEVKAQLFEGLDDLELNPHQSMGYYGDFRIDENNDITFRDVLNPEIRFYSNYTSEQWSVLKHNVDVLLSDVSLSSIELKITNELGEVLESE